MILFEVDMAIRCRKCKELGIETLPPAELQRLKEEWRHDVPKATEEKEETANQEPETDF